MTEQYHEGEQDPTGEAIRKVLEDAAWIEEIDPDFYNQETISTEELKKKLGITDEESNK